MSFGPESYVWLGSLLGEPESTVAIAHRERVVRGDPGRPLRITGLPRDGSEVFVRLFYRPGRVWAHEDFRFVAEP